MLKHFLVISLTCLTLISSAQSCEVDVSFNQSTNNLICFFDSQVDSHCPVLEYYWDFGDEAQSNLSSPVHTFPAPGVYLVCLSVVATQNGENEIYSYCESIYVGLSTPCSVSAHPNLQVMDEVLLGQSLSTAGINTQIISHNWDFGDGTSSTGAAVAHEYETFGDYVVCLTVNAVNGNETCTSVACKAHQFEMDFPEMSAFFSIQDLGNCEFKANSETVLPSNLQLVSRTWVLNGQEHDDDAFVFEWTSLGVPQELCLRETVTFFGQQHVLDYCVALDELCESTLSLQQLQLETAAVSVLGNGGPEPTISSKLNLGLIQVFSTDGKLIFETKSTQNEYRLTDLAAGHYIVHLNRLQSLPLLIQN